MSTSAENPWGSIIHHPAQGTLELRWRQDGEAMTDNAFKATLALFAYEAERFRCPFLLIDATHFRHSFGDGVMEWRDAQIIPRYGAAGTRRMAFVMPEGFPHIGTTEVVGPAIFPTSWFGNRPDAFAWLDRAD